MDPEPHLIRLLRSTFQRPRALVTAACALICAGAWMGAGLPLEWVPSVEVPSISITAFWPDAPPRAVERYVTAPMERALQGVAGTAKLESYSREGQAYLRLEVSRERALGSYVAEVLDRLASLRDTLPERVVPRLTREVPEALRDEQGFLTLQLVGRTSPEELRRVAEEGVAPRLRSLSGISRVTVEGGEERELLVLLDRDRLRVHGLAVDAVRQRLADAFLGLSFGWFHSRGGQSLFWSPGEESSAALGRIVLAAEPDRGTLVRLADVGRVVRGPAPVGSISRVDGNPVVTLELDRTPGSNLLAVADRVRSSLAMLRNDLPPQMDVLVAEDRSEDVRKQLRDLAVRGSLGLLMVVAVLLAMLRSGRAAGIVLFTVLAALSLGLALLRVLGLTLNVLTLAGMTLLVGLLVDNASVVVEQLLHEKSRSPGGERAAVAARALRSVALPLLGGTLTTIAVFLPLIYLSGELRELFAPFSILAALTLAFSLLSALLLVPVLGGWLPSATAGRLPRGARSLRRILVAPYGFAARHPGAVLLLLALGIGLPMPLLPDRIDEPEGGWTSREEERSAQRYNATLGSVPVRNLRLWLDPLVGGVTRPFLKEVEMGDPWDLEDRFEIAVRIKPAPGSGIERADESMRPFEQRALEAESVRRTLTRVTESTATLRVLFPDGARSSVEPYRLREELIGQATRIAGMEVSVSGLVPMGFFSGVGNAAGYPVEAYGPDYDGLRRFAETFARRLSRDPRVARVDIDGGRRGEPIGREVLRFRWSGEAEARTGTSAEEIAHLLRSQLFSQTPSLFAHLDGAPRMPVRLVVAGTEDQDLAELLELPLGRGDSTGPRRLGGFADLATEQDPPTIERKDQQYKRYIQVYYRGPYELGSDLIEREIRATMPPPGYRLERPESQLLDETARREIPWVIAGTAALVFLVMAAVLESWSAAALAMLSVPLAWIGIAPGFVWSGLNFSEGAFFGTVLTIGVAVNASLLLIDRLHHLRRARPSAPVPRLALLAVRDRLRPMWTTTLTSIAGMFPLLILPEGGPFWVSLAIAVVGGLAISTLLAPAALVAVLSWRAQRGSEPE